LFDPLNTNIQCLTLNQTQCVLAIKSCLNSEILQNCPLECYSQTFEAVVSASLYPIKMYSLELINNKNISSEFLNETITTEKVKRSVLALNIYYKDLSYKLIIEQEKYKIIDLISNIGGILGLYTGMLYIINFLFF